MNSALRIEVIKGKDLSSDEQKAIIAFCNRAFEEELDALFSAFDDPTHVLGYQDGMLVSHALWVTRWLRADKGPLMRTAYVEAVATEKAFRGLGYATAIMKRVEEEIQGYELGGLSPFSVAYYERLGWELWRGPLYIRTTPGHMNVDIYGTLYFAKKIGKCQGTRPHEGGHIWEENFTSEFATVTTGAYNSIFTDFCCATMR